MTGQSALFVFSGERLLKGSGCVVRVLCSFGGEKYIILQLEQTHAWSLRPLLLS